MAERIDPEGRAAVLRWFELAKEEAALRESLHELHARLDENEKARKEVQGELKRYVGKEAPVTTLHAGGRYLSVVYIGSALPLVQETYLWELGDG